MAVAEPMQEKEVFLYFFFRNGDSRTEGVESMLASLVEQLFRTGIHLKGLFNIIKPVYDNYGASPLGWDSADRLWDMLKNMLAVFPIQIKILLDALDECNAVERKAIFDRMEGVKARFILTSRPEPDIFAPRLKCHLATFIR